MVLTINSPFTMSTLTITLPESLQEFVTDQVIEQGLTAPEEYIEKLVREEQKNKLWAYYEKEIDKAFESGQPIPMDENFREEIKKKVIIQ
ncbi:MAG: hypothetical protein LBG58_16285 [Planctomycetaceae bacterium]|jgi:antitoxin ParD1/3/4|nr:hypothetical protein [Planctomycetaceae bacterium]